MHPFTFPLLLVAAALVHGHPAGNTPAAQFWEQALPGTPMPNAIADLVQKGIDHSPLLEHHSAALPSSISACSFFDSTCDLQKVAETGIFFHESQLHPGSTMTLSFPGDAESAAILPHDVVENVPFGNLHDALATFNIPADSAEAAQLKNTLTGCQAPPIAGEVKSCTTSLEATVQSAMSMLGATGGGEVWAAASEIPRAGLPRQPYSVRAVTPILQAGYASCHMVPFPYAVYRCHHLAQVGYRSYNVSISGLHEGSNFAMLAVCHLDFSHWNPAQPAFKVLQTRPGGTPVCHFVPYGNLAFVKKATRA
ncbi:hypothetical protein QOZ80_5BG0445540 [Eleusine coracana subsp. coracana]|nr:hypothetical protein QOZ80_5BG0445540 [Eleusine coracana subsp. coracana]